MDARSKLQVAIQRAAATLDARPDPALARVARTASVASDTCDPGRCAVRYDYLKDGRLVHQSWPSHEYLPEDMVALSPEEIATLFVGVLDQEDAHVGIDRWGGTAPTWEMTLRKPRRVTEE